MKFHNEGSFTIELDGRQVHTATDLEGVPLGLFTTRAAALGAQREVNVRKLLIARSRQEQDAIACEIHLEDGSLQQLFAVRVGGEWVVNDDLADSLNEVPVFRPF